MNRPSEDGLPMSPVAEQLFQAALALPEEDRWELLDALLAAQDQADRLPFDPAWLGEIRRRSAEVDAGAVPLTPWSVVRERVRRSSQTHRPSK
jgi:hypothetical protein